MYQEIKGRGEKIIRVWNKFVPMESGVYDQARAITELPDVFGVSLMPDAHVGIGSCVGTVIATKNIVIPAAVGVDIGCGMIACRISLKAEDLPDNLHRLRSEIEAMVPVGFDEHTVPRLNGQGHQDTRTVLNNQYENLKKGLDDIVAKHPIIEKMVKDASVKEAEAFKKAEILRGEGEAARKKLVMEADGQLDKKLEAVVKINAYYADAIKSAQPGAWSPTVVMGGSGQGNGGQNAATLVDLMTAKTAKELGVDLSVRSGGSVKK